MILAFIAMFAALNTRSDYQFVDVSQIAVTGDKEASVGENIKGEHVARFYEWLAESKWIMEKCGANIPASLRSWNPPSVHNVSAMQDAINAYRDTASMNSTNSVMWIRGDIGSNYECYSATVNGDRSSLSVSEIANKSWEKFCSTSRYKPYDYSTYHRTTNSEIPFVMSGSELLHEKINKLNDKSVSPANSGRVWFRIGANRIWTARHGVSTTTTWCGEISARDYGPFWYYPNWGPKRYDEIDYRFSHLTPNPYDSSGEYMRGKYTLPNIVKADYVDALQQTATTRMDSDGSLSFYVGDNEISGRSGIGIYQKIIYLFICCWKCGFDNDNWKMNIKVCAKEITDNRGHNIRDAIDQVESSVDEVGGNYKTSYVSILFAAHGTIYWIPNATENAFR